MAQFNILLLALCCFLAAALYEVTSATPAPDSPSVDTASVEVTDPKVLSLAAIDIGTFADLVERPMFSETRRPPVEAIAPIAPRPAAPAKPDLRLTGIALVGGEPRAIIEVGGRQAELFRPGQTIAGWRLADIEASRIVLQRGAESYTVPMADAGADASDTPPAPLRTRVGGTATVIRDMADVID